MRCLVCDVLVAPHAEGFNPDNHSPACRAPGLGDRVARMIRRLGFKRQCSDCEHRRALLNRAGEQFVRFVKVVVRTIFNSITR